MSTYIERAAEAIDNLLNEISIEREKRLTLSNQQRESCEVLPDHDILLIAKNMGAHPPIDLLSALMTIDRKIKEKNGFTALNEEMHTLDDILDKLETAYFLIYHKEMINAEELI